MCSSFPNKIQVQWIMMHSQFVHELASLSIKNWSSDDGNFEKVISRLVFRF